MQGGLFLTKATLSSQHRLLDPDIPIQRHLYDEQVALLFRDVGSAGEGASAALSKPRRASARKRTAPSERRQTCFGSRLFPTIFLQLLP